MLVLVLVGCTEPMPEEGDRAAKLEVPPITVPIAPGACAANVSLNGMANSVSTPVGPFAIDTTGIDICLALDSRDNIREAHFAAGTPNETGAASSFELALFDANANLLRRGWDVTWGAPLTSHANLEYGVAVGQVLQAVLHVAAKAGTANATIDLWLFEPYE